MLLWAKNAAFKDLISTRILIGS